VGGIGMSDVATNGSPVSYYGVSYNHRSIMEDRVAIADEIGAIKFRLTSQCAKAQFPISLLDIPQAINTVDVDQDRWPGEAESQERDEAMTARENFGFIAVLVQ